MGKANWPLGRDGSCTANAASQAVASAVKAFEFHQVRPCEPQAPPRSIELLYCLHAHSILQSLQEGEEEKVESGQQMWILVLAEYALGEAAREAALVELRRSSQSTQFVPIPMVKIADVVRRPEDLRVRLDAT